MALRGRKAAQPRRPRRPARRTTPARYAVSAQLSCCRRRADLRLTIKRGRRGSETDPSEPRLARGRTRSRDHVTCGGNRVGTSARRRRALALAGRPTARRARARAAIVTVSRSQSRTATTLDGDGSRSRSAAMQQSSAASSARPVRTSCGCPVGRSVKCRSPREQKPPDSDEPSGHDRFRTGGDGPPEAMANSRSPIAERKPAMGRLCRMPSLGASCRAP